MFLFVPSIKQGKAHKFARPFRGPYRIMQLYENGADIRPVDHPQAETIRVSLNRLRVCPDELKTPCEKLDSNAEMNTAIQQDVCSGEDAGTQKLHASRSTSTALKQDKSKTGTVHIDQDHDYVEHSILARNKRDLQQPKGTWAGRLRSRQTVEDDMPKGGEM